MRLRTPILGIFMAFFTGFFAISPGFSAEGEPVVVLDTSGYWRVHTTLRPPVLRTGETVKELKSACRTALPSADWMLADFLDAGWTRLAGAPFASHNSWSVVSKHNVGFVVMEECSPCLALITLRGKFTVSDPQKVDGLTFSAAYRGGIVVYLNGAEIARGHLSKKPTDPFETLGDDYPVEAYLKPDGNLLQCDQGEKDDAVIARWELRTRRLENVSVPSRLLRRGVNVLAVEVHRAPYHEVLFEKTQKLTRGHEVPAYMWSTCGLVSARLSATDARGLTPNVVRPAGFRVWNSPLAMPDFDMDHGGAVEPPFDGAQGREPVERLRALRIVAACGGRFSGKVVAGSDAAMKGLRADVSDFTSPDGATISAKNALIRYALPTSYEPGSQRRYCAGAALFDGLTETPPAEVPVREKEWVRGNWVRPGQPAVRFGAVCPVWVTVDVPRDARPGDYRATLTVRADPSTPLRAGGETPVAVPVELKVAAFALPSADRLSTTVDFVQSPESVASHYDVPLWSDRHFELLAESFKRLGEVGNRSVYIPLICRTNLGNEQSMVRWVKKPGGGYTHDLSIVERYVDLAMKHMGRPRMVVLYAWDIYLGSSNWRGDVREGGRPKVSLLDERAGDVSTLELPDCQDPQSEALWKPLGEKLTALLKQRGLDPAMMLGVSTDSQPSPGVVALYKEVFPGVPWMRHGHSQRRDTQGEPIAYQCLVWSSKFVASADGESQHGWSRAEDWTQFCRSREVYPVVMARLLGEMNIQGSQRGFGRIGLDFWPVLKDKRGRLTGSIQARFPESDWRNLDWMIHAFVPPGPDGALATTRLVLMREGLQECEARIVVERALVTPELRAKLGDELTRRCERLIRERTRVVTTALENHFVCGFGNTSTSGHGWWSTPGQVGTLWYVASGWQELSEELYAVAAEVTRKVGKN